MTAHRRHDISDHVWERLQARLPGRAGSVGRPAQSNRQFVDAVFWILRTGAPWRDLPPDYGDWKNTHRRFNRRRDKGIWEALLEELTDDADYEWLMIDAAHCKVYPHAAGAVGGNEAMGRTKGGLAPRYIWPWMRLLVRSELFTTATASDCGQACALIDGLSAEKLLADKGYDSNEIIETALKAGMEAVIPPRSNRKEQRHYDKYQYRLRHLVENEVSARNEFLRS